MKRARKDKRAAEAMRKIECSRGVLSRADGSVRFNQGRNSLIVAAFGPIKVPRRKEKLEEATVQVEFKPASGAQTKKHKQLELLVHDAIANAVLSSLHPCTLIKVVIQVVEADGSLLAASINASCLALIDAGVQMSGVVSAAAVAVDQKSERLLLDPTQEEEDLAGSLVTAGFGSGSGDLVVCDTLGMLDMDTFSSAVRLAAKAAKRVEAFTRRFFDTIYLGNGAKADT